MPINAKDVVWEDKPAINADDVTWDNQPMTWSQTAGSAVRNIIPSGGKFFGNLATAVRHPIDTISSLQNLIGGEVYKAMPQSVQSWANRVENPETVKESVATADAVNSFYKDRYGSEEGFKRALATDPVGVAADASTVLGLGGGLLNQIPAAGKYADILNTASNVTNPISAAVQVLKGGAKLGGWAAKHALGLSTMTGGNTIEEAAKAGYAGDSSFMDNLKGNVPMTDVLDTAKQNLQNMASDKAANYRANMAAVSGDKTVLSFDGIDDAINKADQLTKYKGQIKNAAAANAVQKIGEAVADWKNLDPGEYHTPEGLDALKQKIGGILESIPYEEKTARLAAGKVYNAVKDSISDQAPVYADTMKAYSDASDQIKEIERALSLGRTPSADTAMRKLQSLLRNNVNTNYGNRLDLAKALQEQGGNDILPAIAGQSMNSWLPRGLGGQTEALGTIGTSIFHNPYAAALLPFESPKVVGAATYGAGRLARALTNARGIIPITDQNAKLAALLMSQAGQNR